MTADVVGRRRATILSAQFRVRQPRPELSGIFAQTLSVEGTSSQASAREG